MLCFVTIWIASSCEQVFYWLQWGTPLVRCIFFIIHASRCLLVLASCAGYLFLSTSHCKCNRFGNVLCFECGHGLADLCPSFTPRNTCHSYNMQSTCRWARRSCFCNIYEMNGATWIQLCSAIGQRFSGGGRRRGRHEGWDWCLFSRVVTGIPSASSGCFWVLEWKSSQSIARPWWLRLFATTVKNVYLDKPSTTSNTQTKQELFFPSMCIKLR